MTGEDGTADLGARIRSGLAWKAGSQITLQITRVVVALVLARMLAPSEWGVAAMVLVFSSFVVVFTDSALGTALIQRRHLYPGDRSTVFWASVGIGVALAAVGIALAEPLARFYGEPKVEPLFAAVAIGYLVTALGTTHQALLMREMQFRKLELRLIAATAVGAVAGITVALADFGAWAIVAQQLAEATTSTALLWYLAPWRPSARFAWASLQRLGGFAGNVFGENLLYQAGRNLGNLLVGRFLGAAALGAYGLAMNVILLPFSRIASPFQQVFFPAFSRMSHDRERVAEVWIRATRLVGAISIPSLVGLAIVAPDFVDVALGARWDDVTPLVQILALAGIIQSLQTLSGEVLLALDRSGWLLLYTALWFVATLASFAVGVRWGVIGVAACYAISTALVEPVRAYLTCRALDISMWRFAASLSGVAQATVVMSAALVVLRPILIEAGFPTGLRLATLVATGGTVYVAACVWRAPEVGLEVRTAIERRRHSARSATETAEATL